MTKAGALKALNGLTDYGLLEKSINKKKKLYTRSIRK